MGLPQRNNTPNRNVKRPTASKGMASTVVDGSDDTGILNPTITTTPPSGDGVINTGGKSLLRLIFGGTDAEDRYFDYHVIGYTPTESGGAVYYIGQLLAKGRATLGATILPAAIDTDGFLADTITNTLGLAGASLRSKADDSVATLDLDVRGCLYVKIQVTEVQTAATAYVWGTLGEQFSNISAT